MQTAGKINAITFGVSMGHGEADDHPHNYDFIERSFVPRVSWSKWVTVIVLRVINDKLGLLREREIAVIEENSQSTT
jgi:hypothetical protein